LLGQRLHQAHVVAYRRFVAAAGTVAAPELPGEARASPAPGFQAQAPGARAVLVGDTLQRPARGPPVAEGPIPVVAVPGIGRLGGDDLGGE